MIVILYFSLILSIYLSLSISFDTIIDLIIAVITTTSLFLFVVVVVILRVFFFGVYKTDRNSVTNRLQQQKTKKHIQNRRKSIGRFLSNVINRECFRIDKRRIVGFDNSSLSENKTKKLIQSFLFLSLVVGSFWSNPAHAVGRCENKKINNSYQSEREREREIFILQPEIVIR